MEAAAVAANTLRVSRVDVETPPVITVSNQVDGTSQLVSACLQRRAPAADPRHCRHHDDDDDDDDSG